MILNRLIPKKLDDDCQDCLQARESLLQSIVTTFVIIGGLAYIPSIYAAYFANFFDIIIIDSLVYSWVIYLFFAKNHSYDFRAYSLVFLIFFLATFLLIKLGVLSAGVIWLFFAPIISTLLISYYQGIAMIILNVLVLGFVGSMEYFGLFKPSIPEDNIVLWLVIVVNFILLNILTIKSIDGLLHSLQSSLVDVKVKQSEIALIQEATIDTVASLAEYRDNETGNHIRRTQYYVRVLAQHLSQKEKFSHKLSNEYIELLYKSAPLHDIGKIGVADNILLKAGKLTVNEFEEMKQHTVYGRDALLKSTLKLGDNHFLQLAATIAYSHHEKWDGSGYPLSLKGDDIPLAGRIMAVADVYDALISRRVYKEPMSHKDAVQYIIDNNGSHFDPDMVSSFIESQNLFFEIANKFSDSEIERKLLKNEMKLSF